MKKYKKKQSNTFTIFGINGCINVLMYKKYQIIRIDLMQEGSANKSGELKSILTRYKHQLQNMPKAQYLKKYSNMRTQGIVIHFVGSLYQKLPNFTNSSPNICLLALDNVEDPQNFGQIIRTAECGGIDGIIIPEHHSTGLTNTAMQVSQGAFSHMPIYKCTNLRQELKNLKSQGFWSIGVENSIKAKQWCNIDYTGKVILVLGSEGKGIRPIIIKECDHLATIPMSGKINSLNVSAAVSAIVFERQRQLLSIDQQPI